MKKIEINVSKPYNVLIGKNLLDKIGSLSRPLCNGNKAMIITDDNVEPLYYEAVKNSLENSGFQVYKYVIANGEASKNSTNFIKILNTLAEYRFTRTDTLFALGGGVVGDLTGFCASVYLRGISFIQIPTTLLAAVDSSVGGKTAIDLDAGKNLAGAFYQPKLVLFDMNTLDTLSDEIFSDGMAEVIKYGMIYDKELFNNLKRKQITEDIISRCVEIKRDVVMVDEFDNGLRKILNFGHTMGHAIEKCSNFQLTHGTCVAIGMALITKYAVKAGKCSNDCYDELCEVVQLYNLPTECDYSSDVLFNSATSDKKREGDKLSIILPLRIGKCIIEDIKVSDFSDIINIAIER